MVKKEAVPPSTLVVPSMEDIMKDVHGSIERALEARSQYLTQEAGTMTLMKTRRLLEEDLNVEQGFLDPYKGFVKDLIHKILNIPKSESPKIQETELKDDDVKSKDDEVEVSADQKPIMKRLKKKADSEEMKESVTKDEGTKDPVDDAGLSSMEEGIRGPEVDSQSDAKEEDMESLIWEAARKRVSYFKSEAESLTILDVRRLLEQDLSLERGALDVHKQHIRTVLDQILTSAKEKPVAVTNAKKRKAAALEGKIKLNKPGKKKKPASSEEIEENVSNEVDEETPKVRNRGSRESMKKVVQEDASGDDEKTPKMRNGAIRKSMKKVVQEDASGDDDDDDEPNKEDSSGADMSDVEETEHKKVPKPKKLESKPVYGKKVEHLKSIIKSCGITVPPSVYRKAKQSPEERRETVLIMELEAILLKEGLTASASKDDIKVVRKQKEKLKDLEGIDTSNIIGESRGRRLRGPAINFFAPKRSEVVDIGDEDEEDDEEEEQESDSEEDPNVELQEEDDDED